MKHAVHFADFSISGVACGRDWTRYHVAWTVKPEQVTCRLCRNVLRQRQFHLDRLACVRDPQAV